MMSLYSSLASEVNELEMLLADTPDENVLDRKSLESRLAKVKRQLAETRAIPESPKVRLTFRGKPVLGTQGIAADFAAKAAGAFAEAFSAVQAGLAGPLQSMGPIPHKDRHKLLITGTALGSFGFEFALPPADTAEQPSLLPDDDKSERAMKIMETLLRCAAEGTDDDVADIVEEIRPRAVKGISKFLDLVTQEEAWCGLEFGNTAFRYKDHEQIRTAAERIRDDNIQEYEASFHGEFQGVLPAARTFEFKCASPGELLRGKVGRAVENPDVLNTDWLHRPIQAKFTVIQVGAKRQRYTLKSLEDLALRP